MKRFSFIVLFSLFLVPFSFRSTSIVFAHEVYVLSPAERAQAIATPSPNPLAAIPEHEAEFLGWGVLSLVAILVVLSLSISKLFEKVFDPVLMRLKPWAPFAARMTLAVSLIFSGYFHAFFGPELPFSALASPSLATALSCALVIIGVCIALGFFTRFAAALGIVIFVGTVCAYHTYMLTYANYLGEMLAVFILGAGRLSIDRAAPFLERLQGEGSRLAKAFEPYSFLILRVLFGTALFFASFYAKFLHSNLALDTVSDYHLTQYFHFTPLFLVLGAFFVEALLGLCFASGFEVRFAALVFTFFLTLSILFFGESVWPHIILFGVNITLFLHGYDRYTLEKAIFQRGREGEPVM